MAKMVWVYDPTKGGSKISALVKTRTEQRIHAHAEAHFAGKYTRMDVRFRAQFCYIDAYQEPATRGPLPPDFPETEAEFMERLRNTPVHLCRLRHRGVADKWGLALFLYSSEKYEDCMYRSGAWDGTVEEAFELAAGFHLE